jgi:glycosyltransferase involved in cell wall biosynthesis
MGHEAVASPAAIVFHGPVRVLFLSHPPETPSTRTRILPYLPLLARDGIEAERADLPDGLAARWALLRRVAEFDVVVHQKRLVPSWQFRALRRRAKRLVYDFDDPMVYSRKDGKVERSATRERRFREIVSTADAVVVHAGSEPLAREHGAREVRTIPTPIDLARWTPRDSYRSERLTIGWAGTSANLPALAAIAPALRGRRLRLVADAPAELPGVEVDFVRWTLEGEPDAVRSFDVALAPLSDDAWSRTKMPYKIVTYFAAGVSVVASGLGAVASVIRDGENGLLAGDWAEAIRRLEDEGLRERLGRAGRRTAEADFTVERCYLKWKDLLRSLA